MPRNGSRLPVLTRRWLAAVCAVSAASGIVIAWRIDEQAQPCWTVRQLIDFNRDGQAALKAKTHFAPAGSYEEDSVPTAADYQAWLDGMQQRADRVTAPGLSVRAQRAAALARDFMTGANHMNDEMAKQDRLKPTLPPSANAVVQLDREFVEEMRALNRACPA